MSALVKQFSLPDGRFMNFTGKGEYALPRGAFTSEQVIATHLYLGPSTYFSWWAVRQKPTA